MLLDAMLSFGQQEIAQLTLCTAVCFGFIVSSPPLSKAGPFIEQVSRFCKLFCTFVLVLCLGRCAS